jgi:hypothetical protein
MTHQEPEGERNRWVVLTPIGECHADCGIALPREIAITISIAPTMSTVPTMTYWARVML